MEVFTIGFTKKNAAQFFGILRGNGIKRLVDVRLNNVSQLAGFTKRDDLHGSLYDRFYEKKCRAVLRNPPRQWNQATRRCPIEQRIAVGRLHEARRSTWKSLRSVLRKKMPRSSSESSAAMESSDSSMSD